MATKQSLIVTGYAKMWPREVFDFRKGKNTLLKEAKALLGKSGVYVLYRDDEPYYVGQASGALHDRLYAHANNYGDAYYNFWNFFSAFEVDKKHLGEVEGILIASMPTANRSVPSIRRIPLPRNIIAMLTARRRIATDDPVNLENLMRKVEKALAPKRKTKPTE